MLACSSCYSFSMMHICSVCCSICIKILFSNLRHAGQTHNTLCINWNTRLIKWLWVTQSLNSRASCGKSQSDHSKQACNWSLIALHETWQRLYWLWLLLDIIPTQRMHRRQIWGKGTSNGCSYNWHFWFLKNEMPLDWLITLGICFKFKITKVELKGW